MSDVLVMVASLVAWVLLQTLLLPRLGGPT